MTISDVSDWCEVDLTGLVVSEDDSVSLASSNNDAANATEGDDDDKGKEDEEKEETAEEKEGDNPNSHVAAVNTTVTTRTAELEQEEQPTAYTSDHSTTEQPEVVYTSDASTRQPEAHDSTRTTNGVRRLDFAKLFALLDQSQQQSSSSLLWSNVVPSKSENEDLNFSNTTVLVLMGLTGAGKTTTLLHLAGVQFEEVQRHGCWHLQPTVYPEHETGAALQQFATDCGGDSVTKFVQAHAVEYTNNQTVVILDGPGLDDTDSWEHRVAHHVAWMRAIQSAQSVRPVVVVPLDALGSRFTLFLQSLEHISRLTQLDDFSSFAYVFTKAEGASTRWKKRIPEMLQHLRDRLGDHPDAEDARLAALLDDMIAKTTTNHGAIIVQPLEENTGHETLAALMGGGEDDDDPFPIFDSGMFFQACLSQATTNALRVELQLLVHETAESMRADTFNYELAESNVQTLLRLQDILPDVAAAYAQEARQVVGRHAFTCRTQVQLELARLTTLRHDDPQVARSAMQDISRQLVRLCRWDVLCHLCHVPDADRVHAVIASLVLPFVKSRVMDRITAAVDAITHDPDDVATVTAHRESLRWNMTCLYGLKDAVSTGLKVGGHAYNGWSIQQTFDEYLKDLKMVVELVFMSAEKKVNDASSVEVNALDKILVFLMAVNDDLQKRMYVDDDEDSEEMLNDWAWIKERLTKLQAGLERLVQNRVETLSQTCDLLQETLKVRSEWSSPTALVELDAGHLGRAREYLIALAKSAPTLVGLLPDSLGSKSILQLVSDFDGLLLDYLVELRSFAQVRLGLPKASALKKPRAFVSESFAMNDGLKEAIKLCDSVNCWTDFNSEVVAELKQLLKETLHHRRVTQVGVAVAVAAAVILPVPK